MSQPTTAPIQAGEASAASVARRARAASRALAKLSAEARNGFLMAAAKAIEDGRQRILDANARRVSPTQGVWLQVLPGEVVSCNGCHAPATAQHPISHGRQNLFQSVWAGAPTSGVAFPGTISTGATAFIPNQGETMAQARMRISCASDTPPCAQMVPAVKQGKLIAST